MRHRLKLKVLSSLFFAFLLAACQQVETSEVQTMAKGGKVTQRFEDGKELIYELIDGDVVIGDMVLGTKEEFDALIAEYYREKSVKGQELNGQALETERCTSFLLWCAAWDTLLWPNGIIRYEIAQGTYAGYKFFPEQINAINRAIQHWQDRTPLRFQAATSGNRVIFRPEPYKGITGACFAETGYQHRRQYQWLPPGCGEAEIIHEIGHTIGLEHEHQRCDRDNAVTILYKNILASYSYAFNKLCGDVGNDLGSYDYKSIMHYRKDAFTSNFQDTIVSKGPRQPVPSTNPSVISSNNVRYGTGYRYRKLWPCQVTVNHCSYHGGTGSGNFGLGTGGTRLKIWIRGDGGNYRVVVTKYKDGTRQTLGDVSSTDSGSTYGYLELSTGDNNNLGFVITPLSSASRSYDLFVQGQ